MTPVGYDPGRQTGRGELLKLTSCKVIFSQFHGIELIPEKNAGIST
jgi:hypothetical protein